MSTRAYSERQMEVSNMLSSVEGVSTEVADEIVSMMGEAEQQSRDSIAPIEDIETVTRWRIMQEPDWRKRTSLSAMLISRSLEY